MANKAKGDKEFNIRKVIAFSAVGVFLLYLLIVGIYSLYCLPTDRDMVMYIISALFAVASVCVGYYFGYNNGLINSQKGEK
jgi:ABC-type Mn2+/Zn2+ transport system permease subunit